MKRIMRLVIMACILVAALLRCALADGNKPFYFEEIIGQLHFDVLENILGNTFPELECEIMTDPAAIEYHSVKSDKEAVYDDGKHMVYLGKLGATADLFLAHTDEQTNKAVIYTVLGGLMKNYNNILGTCIYADDNGFFIQMSISWHDNLSILYYDEQNGKAYLIDDKLIDGKVFGNINGRYLLLLANKDMLIIDQQSHAVATYSYTDRIDMSVIPYFDEDGNIIISIDGKTYLYVSMEDGKVYKKTFTDNPIFTGMDSYIIDEEYALTKITSDGRTAFVKKVDLPTTWKYVQWGEYIALGNDSNYYRIYRVPDQYILTEQYFDYKKKASYFGPCHFSSRYYLIGDAILLDMMSGECLTIGTINRDAFSIYDSRHIQLNNNDRILGVGRGGITDVSYISYDIKTKDAKLMYEYYLIP